MPPLTEPWKLEDLIDFETELVRSAGVTEATRREAMAAAEGQSGTAARRVGLRVWLEHMRQASGPHHGSAGRRFIGALAWVTFVLCGGLWLSGITAVLGLVDWARGGMNVALALAILLGAQWLLLFIALGGWLVRLRGGGGLSVVQATVAKLVRRVAGAHDAPWWHSLAESRGTRDALWWQLARLAQSGGMAFNGGVLCGLAGLVLVKHVGFFWETTTDGAMRAGLESTVNLLATPWAAWWPAAVPNSDVIEASRWLPGDSPAAVSGPAAWWLFLLMAVFVWGLLPRAILWVGCWWAGQRTLANLDFQSRAQRALWREISGPNRVDVDEKPLDGVLVLDVGGTGLTKELMRPFLLRRLRVHPAGWQSVAVLDAGAELLAAQALAQAPAGVVLLAEGWALSPPRMSALHANIRKVAGSEIAVKFLVANVGSDLQPLPPTAEERCEWERFVDGLRDPAAEVFCFENLPPIEI
jgi:hypothetical protein